MEEGAEGGRGAVEHDEFGEHHPRHARHQRQPHQRRDDSPSHGVHQHQHQHEHQHHQQQQVGNTPERRSGRGERGTLKPHFGDAVGGRPRSEGALSGSQSPPPGRTPVDGGHEEDAHWEASKGIGTLRRGKSAGTFLLHQQHPQQEQHQRRRSGSARHGGGGSAGVNDGTTGAAGERNHQARENVFDSSAGRAPGGRRHPDDDTRVTSSGLHGEDQHTVSDLTASTSPTHKSGAGTIPPPPEQRQGDVGGRRGANEEENHRQSQDTIDLGSYQRQENRESSRAGDSQGSASVSACNGLNTSPQDHSGRPSATANGEGAAAGRAGGQPASHTIPGNTGPQSPEGRDGPSVNEAGNSLRDTTKSAGAVTATTTVAPVQTPAPAPAPAPAASLSEMQDRGKIQHSPKTVSDVVLAAAGGSGTESPQASRKGGKASEGGSAKAAGQVGDEGGCRAKDGAVAPGAVAPEETAIGDESDGDREDSKHQRQQRALRAFLQGVSEGCRSTASAWREQCVTGLGGHTPFTQRAEFMRASSTTSPLAVKFASNCGWRSACVFICL